jgi:iron(III) transport system substrate-binding protein
MSAPLARAGHAALRLLVLFAPLLLAVLPILLRPVAPPPAAQAARLVVITPHGAETRAEFGRAFTAWAARELGTTIEIDWRTPGGTAEIITLLGSKYQAALAARHPGFAARALRAFNDPSLDAPGEDLVEERAVRAAFLASDLPADDLDLIWGGGEFNHRDLAAKGYLVDAGLLRAEPAWFTDAVIPQRLSGETMWDPQGRYYGTCLSSFGICYNPDRLAALADPRPPTTWASLGEARFLGATIMTDPTKSAAVVSSLERLIQECMADAMARGGDEATALGEGWRDGFTLIKRIVGNAAFVLDGASVAVRQVARGEACAGVCIDFNARAEAEWTERTSGRARLVYVSPSGGTSLSADPIALLRGAPHRGVAVAFMRFVLSPEGQRLYNYRVGTEGGPARYALRRLPIRRDAYGPDDRARMSDPGEDPYALAAGFTYRGAWTGPHFRLIGWLAKAVVLDPRGELEAAWRAIVAAGGPERVPEAYAAFAALPFPYADARARGKELFALKEGRTDAEQVRALALLRAWTEEAQGRYRLAARLASEGR